MKIIIKKCSHCGYLGYQDKICKNCDKQLEKSNGVMENNQWISVDPCETCPSSPKNDPQAFDGCEVFNTCVQYGVRIGGLTAQNKLLEYLIDQCQINYQKGILPPVVTRQELQEMKFQLEEKNGQG